MTAGKPKRDRSTPRLTAFQSLMRGWSKLAPYNFVHALRLAEPPDVDRWQRAVAMSTRQLNLVLNQPPVEQRSGEIEAHLQSELLRPFSDAEAPIRFFVINQNADEHWFGATIDHWFADDFSCRVLLEQIYERYRENVSKAPLTDYRPGSAARVLHGEFSTAQLDPAGMPGRWWQNWRSFIEQAVELRRACRTPMRDPTNFDVRILRAILPEGALDAGRALAKRHEATLHDLFLAATAQTFSATYNRQARERRNHVAIASAMDLRRFDREPLPNRFGLSIGYYIVSEERPHEHSLGEVIESIAAQSRQFKACTKADPLKPALFLWRLPASRRSRATHYQRGAPLVAGLSNVNLSGSWVEQSEIREFRRVGPTGPIVPMVFMITTLRGRIYLDVTYRTTAFEAEQAHALVNEIIKRLAGGAESTHGG